MGKGEVWVVIGYGSEKDEFSNLSAIKLKIKVGYCFLSMVS